MARLRSVRIDQADSIARLRIERPYGMNAIHESLIGEIADQFSVLAASPSVEAIWILGRADMFLAGVDLPFFGRCLLSGDIDRILSFTRSAHALLDQIAECPKPVGAFVQGSALGGGLELALACHGIAASPSARFAFPESSLGIYPGMGGTQRAVRRVGVGLAKWMIYTGATVPAGLALEMGLIDGITDEVASEEGGILASVPRRSIDAVLSERSARIEDFFMTYPVDELLDPGFPMPPEPYLVRAVVQVRSKAPLALKLAEGIIDRGMVLPLREGLKEEYSQLGAIFSTVDARTGLLSFGKSSPRFVGR